MDTLSRGKVKIRLTGERLNHILINHPEMVQLILDIPKTIEYPDIIFQGARQEHIAVKNRNKFFIVVVYKEENEDGFVITAFRTRSINYLSKREIIWKKR